MRFDRIATAVLVASTMSAPALSQHAGGTGATIPVSFRGAWAPTAQACLPGRDQLTVVERGGLEVTATGVNAYEVSYRPTRALQTSAGAFVFRATPFSEGEAGSPATVTLRATGQQLTMNATGGGQYNRSYVRCGSAAASPVIPAPVSRAVPSSTVRSASASAPRVGHCIGGQCSWGRQLSSEVVRSDTTGRLLRLSILGGTQSMRGRNAPIRWERAPSDVYVFCSTALPAVILPYQGTMQVDILDFQSGVPGVLESSASIYANACHGSGADWQSPTFARRFGYHAIPEQAQNISISRPEEIFDQARRMGRFRAM